MSGHHMVPLQHALVCGYAHTLALALFFPGNLLLDVILGQFSGLDEH